MIQSFYFNPFRVATYIVYDEQKNAVIIDPGMNNASEKERFAAFIAQNGLQVKAQLLTHAHLDHLLGTRFVYEQYGIIPHVMPEDDYYFTRQLEQSSAFGCEMEDKPLTEYIPLEDDQILTFGTIRMQVIATPGHTQGGCCFLLKDAGEDILFSGDTLFACSIGRTDLPQGDYNSIIRSIQKRLMVLPDATRIYPGHGYESTIGIERTDNPYI